MKVILSHSSQLYRDALVQGLASLCDNVYVIPRASTKDGLAVSIGSQKLQVDVITAVQLAEMIAHYRESGRLERISSPLMTITRRERDVLTCLTQGMTNKDIALALGLKPVTVKLHMHSICRKLGAANRTQAALMARENLMG